MSGQLPLFSGPPVDPRYDHVWAWGRPAKALPPYEPQLKGRRCRVACRAKPRYSPLLVDNPHVRAEVMGDDRDAAGELCGAVRVIYPLHDPRGSAPLNVAVEFPDGELVCAPRWAVRRAK